MKLFALLQHFGKTAGFNRLAYQKYQKAIGEYYFEFYVAPFAQGKNILDVGCAEGGVLEAFAEHDFVCTGLEYQQQRLEFARQTGSKQIEFILGNIEEIKFTQQFDVILMLDVIEHLVHKRHALENIKQALSPEGICVISFPPFTSAFGGHQQVMSSILKFFPFVHLLPENSYRWLLQHLEKKNIEAHLNNYRTGITIRQFEELVAEIGFDIRKKIFHFIRPRQALRFGIKIRQNNFKFLRDFLSTGAIYILTRRN